MESLVILLVVLIVLNKLKDRRKFKNYSREDEEHSGRELKRFELESIESKNLLTVTELGFYHQLRKSLPEYDVHAQVSVYQILRIKKGLNYERIWNRFNRMTFDFVLVDDFTKVLAVIELDDKSHNYASSQKRDAKKNELLAHLQIPMIRIQVDTIPKKAELRKIILESLRPTQELA
jgi:hypothetical protein